MKITAQDLLRFGVIDSILKEPAGGAHRDPDAMIATTGEAIARALDELRPLDGKTLRGQRREKFPGYRPQAGMSPASAGIAFVPAEDWGEIGGGYLGLFLRGSPLSTLRIAVVWGPWGCHALRITIC